MVCIRVRTLHRLGRNSDDVLRFPTHVFIVLTLQKLVHVQDSDSEDSDSEYVDSDKAKGNGRKSEWGGNGGPNLYSRLKEYLTRTRHDPPDRRLER